MAILRLFKEDTAINPDQLPCLQYCQLYIAWLGYLISDPAPCGGVQLFPAAAVHSLLQMNFKLSCQDCDQSLES